jgi:hypothetical protein
VRFDHYFLESSLYTSGRVEDTVQRLVAAGKTFEKDGALWLRTTDYGDDKDRVMRKSDGSYTYFVPDVAYHVNKFERGFTKVINVQGTDHHGTVARVRAGLQAAGLGIPAGYPDYVLHKMVTVMKGGEEVKISKRAGSYVTLRDLIDWTSRDAVRFFLISRKADSEFTFDVDLALKQTTRTRSSTCSTRMRASARCWRSTPRRAANRHAAAADLSLLAAPSEQALMLKLADYPDMLTRATTDLAPHDVAFYLRDLAAALHTWYAAERFLADDAALARARMALLAATRQVLRNGAGAAGCVSAPVHDPGHGPDRGRQHELSQRGGFALGLVVGLLIGLALALGVALYITKAPVPFVNKVPQRTPSRTRPRGRTQPQLGPQRTAGVASRPGCRPPRHRHPRRKRRPWQPRCRRQPRRRRPAWPPGPGATRPPSCRVP